jgi:hypothetical protein
MSSPQGERTDMNDRSTNRPRDRRRRPARLASLGLLVIVGVLAAGCGDDGGGASSAADRERENREAWLEYAQCMRDNGVDMPDPGTDGGLKVEDVTPEEFREAEKACKKSKAEIEPPELSEEEQEEFREAMLANARCMRERGIENFPDPTFDKDGGASIEIPAGSGFDEDDPDVKEAMEACEDTLPPEPSGGSAP